MSLLIVGLPFIAPMKLKYIFTSLLVLSVIGLLIFFGSNYLVKKNTAALIYNSLSAVPKTKVAIIFGAGIKGDEPSKYLKDRLDAGIALFKSGKVDKILLSGDNGREEYDELTVMKIYCRDQGVDTAKIYIDYAGFDSYSTLYRAKALFKIDTAILISQRFHLSRCIYIGNKLGVNSIGLAANRGNYNGYKYVSFREKFAIVKATLDVFRGRKPKYLGEPVNIDGPNNYTKE